MGTHSQIEANLRAGRLTYAGIREKYRACLIEDRAPEIRARAAALNVSRRNCETFRQYYAKGVDSAGEPLADERKKVFDTILEIFEEVEQEQSEGWKRVAAKLEDKDPYKAMRVLFPSYLADAEGKHDRLVMTQQFEQAMVKVQGAVAKSLRAKVAAVHGSDVAAEVVEMFVVSLQSVLGGEV